MKNYKILKILFWVLPIFLLITNFCFAADALELKYPTVGGQTITTKTLLPDFVKYIFNLTIAISGLIAFGVLIYAGIKMMLSSGNVGAMTDAKEKITSAFLGLIILLCSWIILSTINPQLTTIELPQIDSSSTTTP